MYECPSPVYIYIYIYICIPLEVLTLVPLLVIEIADHLDLVARSLVDYKYSVSEYY